MATARDIFYQAQPDYTFSCIWHQSQIMFLRDFNQGKLPPIQQK